MIELAQTVTARVLRCDKCDAMPHFSTHIVEKRDKMSLLEVFEEIYRNDSSFTFPYSCRIGKCGSCTVRLNGKPVLACRYIVQDHEELVVEPIEFYTVEKDLIIDRDRFEEQIRESIKSQSHDGSSGFLPDSSIPYKALTDCIGCLACDSACPVLKTAPDKYSGPATTVTIAGPGRRIDDANSKGVRIGPNIDYCSLCLNCADVCPYELPLHVLNARAKKTHFDKKTLDLHDYVTGRFGVMGNLAGHIPGTNAILRSKIIKSILERFLHFDRRMDLPTFRSSSLFGERNTSSNGKRRVAFFVGCYAKFVDPSIAEATIDVLEHNGVSITIPKQVCCGMPLLSKGNIGKAKNEAKKNLRFLHTFIAEGYDIIASCTSCSWMLKRGYTDILNLEEANLVAPHTYDLGEYLLKMKNEGHLDTTFSPVARHLAYHAPCHLKSQNVGTPFIELLKLIPKLKISDVTNECCGLSGTYGFKKGKYEIANAIGKRLFDSVKAVNPDAVISECGTCRLQIAHGTDAATEHPVRIIHESYFGQHFVSTRSENERLPKIIVKS